MDRWLISPVEVEIDGVQIDIDSTIQAERKELMKSMADGSDSVAGVEQSYLMYTETSKPLHHIVHMKLTHGGQCIDSGKFHLRKERGNTIRLSQIRLVN